MTLCIQLISDLPKGNIWRGYVIQLARDPDLDSEFDTCTSDIRHLPDDEFFDQLMHRGYNGILFFLHHTEPQKKLDEGMPIGGIFWQEHRYNNTTVWRVFRLLVNDNFRNQGYGCKQVAIFLRYAHERAIKTIFLGNGGDQIVRHIFEKIHTGEITLPFPIRCDPQRYTISFSYIAP